MKTTATIFCFFFSVLISFGQEKTKEQIKEEKKTVKQKEIDALVDSRQYEFKAIRAYPISGKSIDMTTNPNFFRFQKDTIHSEMPFFGQGYNTTGYGASNNVGLSFKGEIKNYSLKKEKKSYIIKADVKDDSNSYSIVLTVYFEGEANLSITSSHRSQISYRGQIDKLETEK